MKKILGRAAGLLERFQFELAIFFFLLLRGLPTADFSAVTGWQSMSYVMSYKYGFCSRFLIGTIFRLFSPDFVSARSVALFVNAAVIFDCLIVALLLGALLREAKKRGQLMLAAIPTVLYLAVPLNVSIHFTAAQYAGKLEIFLLPLMLLSAWILLRTEPGARQAAAVSIISVVAMLIYQNYIFLCFPLVLALQVYNLFIYGWKKNNILWSLVICAANGIAFLYLQLFASINAPDALDLAAELQSQTDMGIIENAVFYEYYASFSEFFVDLMLYRYGYQLEVMLFDLLLLSPAIFVYLYIWINSFKGCSDRNERWLLIGTQLCSAAFLPTFIITCDWARWFVWVVLFQAALLLILWYRGFEPTVRALEKTLGLLSRYKAIAALIIVFYLSLTVCSVTEMFVISKTLHTALFG